MPAVPGATELLRPPENGRTFEHAVTVRLGDVDVNGRLRLDAIARLLQDVATADAADAGLDGRFGWVVRRTMIRTDAVAWLDEQLDVSTYCTGTGRSWAERTTTLRGADGSGASIRTVSLWVQVETTTGRPSALSEQFLDIYGPACAGRRVSSRLSIATPTLAGTPEPWALRRVDLDPFDHVNNAANWAFVEEAAHRVGFDARRIATAELEFAAPIRFDEAVLLHAVGDADGVDTWLSVGDGIRSVARLRA